jgi:hypothetical protein
MKKFIAKPDTWYDAGTEVKLVEWICKLADETDYGLFEGVHDGRMDGETCGYDEFDIIEVCQCGHESAAHGNDCFDCWLEKDTPEEVCKQYQE